MLGNIFPTNCRGLTFRLKRWKRGGHVLRLLLPALDVTSPVTRSLPLQTPPHAPPRTIRRGRRRRRLHTQRRETCSRATTVDTEAHSALLSLEARLCNNAMKAGDKRYVKPTECRVRMIEGRRGDLLTLYTYSMMALLDFIAPNSTGRC